MLAPRTRDRSDFGVVACAECGLGRLDPLPSGTEVYYQRAYWEEARQPDGESLDDILAVRNQAVKVQDTERRLRKLAARLGPGTRVLDAGCGSGAFLHAVRERSAVVTTGIEPHESFREHLRREGFEVYPSLLECSGEVYDLVVLFHVLEHLEDPVKFLTQLRPFLAPRGTLVVEVPNLADALLWLYRVPAYWEFYWQYPHIWYFSAGPLRHLLARAGYEVVCLEEAQRYGLANHLQWLSEGVPGPGEKFAPFVSPRMDLEYRDAIIRRGFSDTLWVECRPVVACAA